AVVRDTEFWYPSRVSASSDTARGPRRYFPMLPCRQRTGTTPGAGVRANRGLVMPPPSTPPSSPRPRRRPPPPLPVSWIWTALLIMSLASVVLFVFHNPGAIDYGDFLRLVDQPDLSKHLKKVIFIGTERINGEVDDAEALPKEIKDKLSGKE